MRTKEQEDYDAECSILDGYDEAVFGFERKWGVGRLELLVSDDLRSKFRRQQQLLNEAIQGRDIERLRQACAAMLRGWSALDAAAHAAGASKIEPDAWEIPMSDGKVIALCRTNSEAYEVMREGRYIEVWTTDELRRVIEGFPEIALAKETFPGATVVSARVKPFDVHRGDEIPF